MSAIDYINSEREENPNITMLDIMKGLDEMEAAEDAALKTALGGSTGTFESWFNSCTVNCSSTSAITSASSDAISPFKTRGVWGKTRARPGGVHSIWVNFPRGGGQNAITNDRTEESKRLVIVIDVDVAVDQLRRCP